MYMLYAYIVLRAEFRLHATETAQLPGQLEGGQNGIPGAERYQRTGRQSPIGVDTWLRMTQRVIFTGMNAFVASASARCKRK